MKWLLLIITLLVGCSKTSSDSSFLDLSVYYSGDSLRPLSSRAIYIYQEDIRYTVAHSFSEGASAVEVPYCTKGGQFKVEIREGVDFSTDEPHKTILGSESFSCSGNDGEPLKILIFMDSEISKDDPRWTDGFLMKTFVKDESDYIEIE